MLLHLVWFYMSILNVVVGSPSQNGASFNEKYTLTLFQKYVNGETNFSNRLFRELITECIENNEKDAYLGELTNKVLDYVRTEN